MVIKSLEVAGATNTLRYATTKKIPVFDNKELLNFIEPETYYIVTYSDVNMLEVFLLVQKYRNKLLIVKENAPTMPDDDELQTLFPEHIDVDGQMVPDSKAVHDAIDQFISIFKQMLADFDIIQDNIAIEFVPMIARRFEVRIPISFIDIISALSSPEEINAFIDKTLNGTLNEYINSKEGNAVQRLITIIFVHNTRIPRYDTKYEVMLEAIKYSPLKKVSTDKPYRFKLSSISRFDEDKHVNYSAMMFNTTKEEMSTKMATMSQCKSPIIADFVVELPVQNMMYIMNSFSSEELPISYTSSMKQVIDSIAYVIDFTKKGIRSANIDLSNPDNPAIQERINRLDAYQTRIETAFDILLGTMQKLIQQGEGKCDVTSIFALLPAIVMSRAVISVNNTKMGKYLYHQNDATNIEMFNDIENIVSNLTNQIES